jgi:hypothetical protein
MQDDLPLGHSENRAFHTRLTRLMFSYQRPFLGGLNKTVIPELNWTGHRHRDPALPAKSCHRCQWADDIQADYRGSSLGQRARPPTIGVEHMTPDYTGPMSASGNDRVRAQKNLSAYDKPGNTFPEKNTMLRISHVIQGELPESSTMMVHWRC